MIARTICLVVLLFTLVSKNAIQSMGAAATAPLITSQPQSITNAIGSTATFSATADGAPPVAFQWSKDGVNIQDATNDVLIIRNVQFGDAGNYSATVSNAYGLITSSNAILTVRWPQAGDVDGTFNSGSGIKGTVRATAVQTDGKVLIGGGVAIVQGTSRGRVARLNSDGSLDNTFMNGMNGANSLVYCLAIQSDGKVLIGGAFSSVNGAWRNGIARLNSDGSLDNSFQYGMGGASTVYSLAIQPDGKVLIGGNFRTVNGISRNRIARLNADGTLDTEFLGVMSGVIGDYYNTYVYSIGIQSDGKVLIGGVFSSVNGVSRNRIARLNSDGSLDEAFQNGMSGVNGTINSVGIQSDGKVLIGGEFTTVNGASRGRIARLNADGSFDATFLKGMSGAESTVCSIAIQPDGKVLIGGYFTSVNGIRRNRIARLNADGNVDMAFQSNMSGANGAVFSLALQSDEKVIMGGDFGNVNGISCAYAARLWNVGTLPMISQQPQNATRNFGETASFSAPASGLPSLCYQWYQNGAAILNATASSLVLSNITGAQAGNYFCIVSNAYGSIASQPAVLSVLDPLIQLQPQNIIAYTSQSAKLSVEVEGSWPLNYQWYQNGSAILNANAAQLSLNNVEAGDGGNYYCIVTNSYGAATSQVAVLTVHSASPQITSQPRNATNALGSMAIFTVTSDGAPPLFYQWRKKGGVAIPAATNDMLILRNLQFSDAENYTVTVSNAYGSTISSNAVLTVRWPQAGDLDGSFNLDSGISGSVRVTSIQPDGKVLIGGGFTSVQGFARGYLARLNPDGSIDNTFMDKMIGPNGWVTALATQSDGKVLIGGSFTNVNGLSQNNVARLNADGSLDTAFQSGMIATNNTIYSLAIQEDGKVLVGGYFTHVNGISRKCIARLNTDGSVDATFQNGMSGANYSVHSIAIQPDGKVLIGGEFTSVNGVARSKIARLNEDGSLDTAFQNGMSGANGYVRSLVIQPDRKVLIGGYFESVNGVSRSRIARLHEDGSLDTTFQNGISGANYNVYCLAIQRNGKVLIGGCFSSVNGANRNHIARLNADGRLDSYFQSGMSGADNSIYALAVQPDGMILIAGNFEFFNGVPTAYMARLWDEDALPTLSQQPQSVFCNVGNTASYTVAASGKAPLCYQWRHNKNVILNATNASLVLSNATGAQSGNYFCIVSNSYGSVTSQVAALSVVDPVITRQPQYSIAYNGENATLAVEVDGSTPLRYQWYKSLAGNQRSEINGATDSTLSLQTAALEDAGRYYCIISNAYGSATSQVAILTVLSQSACPQIIGLPQNATNAANSAAAFTVTADGAPPLMYQWNKDGVNIEGATNDAFMIRNVRFGDAGYYSVTVSNAYGSIMSSLAQLTVRWPQAGDVDGSFYPGLGIPGTVSATAVQADGKVLVAGGFTMVQGVVRGRLARLNPDGSNDTSFMSGMSGVNNAIYALAIQSDGKVVIGGGFLVVNGVNRNRIARLNADGSVDATFLQGMSGANESVFALATQPDGKTIIGGYFTRVNGVSRNRIARLNADGSVDTAFMGGLSGADDSVLTVAVHLDGTVLVGGAFTRVNGVARNRIARLNADGSLDAAFLSSMSGADGDVYCLAIQPDSKVVIGGYFSSVNDGVRRGIARLNTDGSVDASFLNNMSGADASVRSLAIQADGRVVIGGEFMSVNDADRGRIARLNSDGSLDTSFQQAVSGADDAICTLTLQPDGKVLIGGLFTSVNGVASTYVAWLHGESPSGSLNAITPVSDGMKLGLYAEPGTTVMMQRSTDLRTWETRATNIISSTGTGSFTDSNPPKDRAFYRVLKQ